METFDLETLDRLIGRAQAAILKVNDRVPDCDLRDELRRTILDQLELLKLRLKSV
jgi:hypothetical protein